MTDSYGIDLPARRTPGLVGRHWLGIIPVAQATVIGDALVQILSLERRSNGALLAVRISRLNEIVLTGPTDHVPWPQLHLTAHDDLGKVYKVDGGAGGGSQSEWNLEYGVVSAIPSNASRLNLTVSELQWEEMSTGETEPGETGNWVFSVDLTREVPARLV